MTAQVRREIVKKLIEAGYSRRPIAGALGVAKSTVDDDAKHLAGTGQMNLPESVIVQRKGQLYEQKMRKKPAPPAAGTGRAKTVGNAMNDKLQVFIGQTTGSLRYFDSWRASGGHPRIRRRRPKGGDRV